MYLKVIHSRIHLQTVAHLPEIQILSRKYEKLTAAVRFFHFGDQRQLSYSLNKPSSEVCSGSKVEKCRRIRMKMKLQIIIEQNILKKKKLWAMTDNFRWTQHHFQKSDKNKESGKSSNVEKNKFRSLLVYCRIYIGLSVGRKAKILTYIHL